MKMGIQATPTTVALLTIEPETRIITSSTALGRANTHSYWRQFKGASKAQPSEHHGCLPVNKSAYFLDKPSATHDGSGQVPAHYPVSRSFQS